MQEVTSLTQSAGVSYDQLRNSALLDATSQSRAFTDFMGLLSGKSSTGSSLLNSGSGKSSSLFADSTQGTGSLTQSNQINAVQSATQTQAAPVQSLVQTDTASTLATTTTAQTTQAATTAVASTRVTTSTDSSLSTAKNAPVSRDAFEQAKSLLTKAGVTEEELSDLSKRVQAGTLTWGQLVQTMGKHTAGSQKSVSLSDSEKASVQTMFQKMGFGTEAAGQMVAALAQGNTASVLATLQSKLSGISPDTTFSFDTNEMSSFCKALGLSSSTAATSVAQKLASGETTVKDLQNGLTNLVQAMQAKQSKDAASDTELAKSLGAIMKQDVAKNARDTSATTTAGASSGGQVKFDLKTKDSNDTSWFDQHEKTQQESSDESWKNFLSKVRTADGQQAAASATASTLTGSSSGASSKEGVLDSAASRLAQAMAGQTGASQGSKSDATSQSAAYSKTAAPKALDQVTEAMLKDLGQGRKQLTIQLDPENLGKVQVVLQVKGKEVNAQLNAQDADTAAMLTSNLQEIKKSLEDKGLTVQNLEVQTGLASRQDQQAAFNAEQHNQAQQQQDMSNIMSQLRMLRADQGGVALDMQNTDVQAILADQGLHLIA